MTLRNSVCRSKARLDGKTVLVTGANAGIGKATVEDLFKRGARVILACRNASKARNAIKEITMNGLGSKVGSLKFVGLNLASFDSVTRCAKHILEKEKELHILINNAGICCVPASKTMDGFESQLGVNYLGHFMLTLLLLPLMIKSKQARIINVSSSFHQKCTINFQDMNYKIRAYDALGAYRQSKLCMILFTKELSKRLADNNIKGVTVYAVHPGLISTELLNDLDTSYIKGTTFVWSTLLKIFGKSVTGGAQTTIHCAVDEKAEEETGLYYSDCAVKTPSRNARNMEDANKLWNLSLKYCKMETFNAFKNNL